MRHRGLAMADATAMIAAQGDPASKRPLADIIIENDGTLAELGDRVDGVWSNLQARAERRP